MKKTSVEEIAMFCDNWTGQSKNRIIHQMLLSATIKIENLNNVQLIFLGKGHTQNCNDSIHSPIKKAKKESTYTTKDNGTQEFKWHAKINHMWLNECHRNNFLTSQRLFYREASKGKLD